MQKTPVYSKDGSAFFGVWQKPEITLDGDEKVVVVDVSNEGQLDLIAHKEYGDRAWWWAIAAVNRIGNVNDEVVAGLEIVIPKLNRIKEALQKTNG